MFFKQVWRNAASNRKDNGLFFGSLVIAIVAFYTLLSIGEQDVVRFLATIESHAVAKLLQLIPVVYMVSLFFVFFLVYFACKYQMDSRRREFGMYLMLGMGRGRLFVLLCCETLWNSLSALLIGLPTALLLTEGISLATAKVVGTSIVGHQFSLSWNGMGWTVCGFVLVQMLSMMILCIPLGWAEPAKLLRTDAREGQRTACKSASIFYFAAGMVLLLTAYCLGIFQLKNFEFSVVTLLVALGALGTFWLYRGLGGFLDRHIRRTSRDQVGLATFTRRQVQENVLSQHRALAVASLLLLVSLSCLAYGIPVGVGQAEGQGAAARSADFSLLETAEVSESFLARNDVQEMIQTAYPVYLGSVSIFDPDHPEQYDGDGVPVTIMDYTCLERVAREVGGDEAAQYPWNGLFDYAIPVSTYNRVLKGMGKEPIQMEENEVAWYTNGDHYTVGITALLEQAVKRAPTIGINGKEYTFLPTALNDNVVADRAISLQDALVVPDRLYAQMVQEMDRTMPFCWNIRLSDQLVNKRGLMLAIQEMTEKLERAGVQNYDSYLKGMGRNLFYTVGISYLTIYLGVLFLLIANTVVGMKFLIQQRKNKGRYATLLLLGAEVEEICASVRRQIEVFFLLVLALAAVSSGAAVLSLFQSSVRGIFLGISSSFFQVLAGGTLLLFAGTEAVYIWVVKRAACREVRILDPTDRR